MEQRYQHKGDSLPPAATIIAEMPGWNQEEAFLWDKATKFVVIRRKRCYNNPRKRMDGKGRLGSFPDIDPGGKRTGENIFRTFTEILPSVKIVHGQSFVPVEKL